MTAVLKELIEKITLQQNGKENTPEFAIGEQLKEIATHEPASAEIINQDIEVSGMGLSDVAKFFQSYSDKNHKSQKVFCITPTKAEELIREFYKLPASAKVTETAKAEFLDLADFI